MVETIITLVFSFQNELNKANEEILARREIKKQQEKAEEQKVIEYMKQKAVSIATAHFYVLSSSILLSVQEALVLFPLDPLQQIAVKQKGLW